MYPRRRAPKKAGAAKYADMYTKAKNCHPTLFALGANMAQLILKEYRVENTFSMAYTVNTNIEIMGMYRFRRGRRSWESGWRILVGLLKKRETQVIANDTQLVAA